MELAIFPELHRICIYFVRLAAFAFAIVFLARVIHFVLPEANHWLKEPQRVNFMTSIQTPPKAPAGAETRLECTNHDGPKTVVVARKWADRNWYQPIAGQRVGEGITLIPRGESTRGAKEHTYSYIDGNQEGAEVLVID